MEEVDMSKMTRKQRAEAKLMYSKLKVQEPIVGHTSLHQKKKRKQSLSRMLREAQMKEAKIEQLERQGDLERSTQLKMKDLWQSALDKSEGKKVRNDAQLIKKTIKKVHKRKEKSRKQWEERIEQTKQRQEKAQKKRSMNIKKRKQAKIQKKIKKRK